MLNSRVLRSADRTVKASDAQLRSFLGVRQGKREGERGADRASFDLLRLGQRKQEGVRCSTRLCLEAQTEQSRRQMLNPGASLESDREREGERGADREAFDRASDSLVALSVPVLARSNTPSFHRML